MKIPVYSSTIRRSEMDAVLTCMVEEKIGPGEMNQKLIHLVRDIFNVEGAIALRSPSLALMYALKALDIPKETGIMISALAPSWQYVELERAGFKPIVLDVTLDTAVISVKSVEVGIQEGGRVLILHETLGSIPNMADLLALNIPIIEDISQSAGAEQGEKKVGTFGVFSILGLEERDMLTSGGGAVLMASERRNGIVLKRIYESAPLTDILPDINASLAFVQLKQLAKNNALRKEMYDLYIHSLRQGHHKTLVSSEENGFAIYSFPVILSSGYKEVKQYVNRKEIDIEFAFTGSVVEYLGEKNTCENASVLLLRCILFPLYPRLGVKNSTKIAKVLGTLP